MRSTRILHQNDEYLIQDQGSSSLSRTITFLARPEAVKVTRSSGLKPIKTNHGEWIPVAQWIEDELKPFKTLPKETVPVLMEILESYLKRSSDAQGRSMPRKRYYFLERGGIPEFTLTPSHPYGLAIKMYATRSLALKGLETADGKELGAKLRQTDQLKNFLIKAADEGYAGAVLDSEDPIYFCLDESENMVFLKLSLNDQEEVEEFLLEEDGTWGHYDGGKDMEFYLDQDQCDRNMVKNLGSIPFLGHKALEHVWTLEDSKDRGKPFILSAEEGPYQGIAGGSVVVLFQKRENAMHFLKERGHLRCEAVLVESLRSLLASAKEKSLTVILEPFNHRAVSGNLWLNGKDMILDSFSGFWIVGDGWSFEKAI